MIPDYTDNEGKHHKFLYHISKFSGEQTMYHLVIHRDKGIWYANFKDSSLYGKGPSIAHAVNDLLDFIDKAAE